LTSTATCSAFRAIERATGELVPTRLLVERVGFLVALIQAMTTAVVAARWNDADLVALGSGVGPDGRALPSKGWMALRRLGWGADIPEAVYVSDRVRRGAGEGAAPRPAVPCRGEPLEAEPGDWWTIVLGTGLRGFVDQLDAASAEDLR